MAPPERQHDDDMSDTSSLTDILDTRDDEGWEDVEQDEETVTIVSLFDDKTFPDARSMLTYCRDTHGFDIWKIKQDLELDFLGLIKLVNYVRSEVAANKTTRPEVSSKEVFEDDKYLQPVLQDDALLYSLDDVFEEGTNVGPPVSEVDELREQLEALQSQFSAYREQVQNVMLDRLEEQSSSGSGAESSKAGGQEPAVKKPSTEADAIERGYFQSYSYNAIHESMIKDRVRTDAYRDFIYDHKDLFKDKVVLDVGCGTGILSMFCAKAGARLVIAVDNSDIIDKAREHVFANGLQSTVKCLRGKIEEVTLPVEKVDVIVSEWMGYCLLYESMLDSVLYARDRYLDPEAGLMVPSHATLRIAPLADSDLTASHIDFWRDIYGFDMSGMLERAHEEALVRVADPKELAAPSVEFLHLDLHTTTVADLTFTKPFTCAWKEGFSRLEGFVVWFDMVFATTPRSHSVPLGITAAEAREKLNYVAFSTGPASETTHWQQGILLIENPNEEQYAAGDELQGEITFVRKQGQERSLDLEVSWAKKGGEGKAANKKKQLWVLD